MRPIEKIGQITLRPLSLHGVTGLALNADASRGTIRVELLNASGYRIPGYTKFDAVPIAGDGLRQRVTWKSSLLANLPPVDVMIRIHLQNAELFALTLD